MTDHRGLARALGLPPLVGFLAAGFVLRGAGVSVEPWLEEVAHAGVLVLLFTVGLRLRPKNLMRAEVLGGGFSHLALFGALLAVILALASSLPSQAMQRMDWSKTSPPTGSKMTSAPRPAVSSFTASRKPFSP